MLFSPGEQMKNPRKCRYQNKIQFQPPPPTENSGAAGAQTQLHSIAGNAKSNVRNITICGCTKSYDNTNLFRSVFVFFIQVFCFTAHIPSIEMAAR